MQTTTPEPARLDAIGPDSITASQEDVTLDIAVDEATDRLVINVTGDNDEALGILLSAEAEDALHRLLTRRIF